MRKYMWCLIAIVLAVILVHPHLMAQQDSVISDEAGNPMDWAKVELLKWAIPLIGSVLYAQWNKLDGFLSRWNNTLKAGVYVALITVMMMLGEFIHVAVSPAVADWGGTFWEGIAAGLVGTLLVKLGINTARQKAATV